MTREDLQSLLKKYPLCRKVLEEMPPPIRNRAERISLGPRKLTARKGEPVETVDLLLEGRMRVLNEFESGSLYGFAYLTPLSYIGSYEVVAGRETYTAATESVSACTLIRLSKEDFRSWFANSTILVRDVAYRMARNACDQSYKHGEVLFYPSAYLIAEYLMRSYDGLEGELRRIPAGRQEIAEDLGFSVRTVNRWIKIFREEGALEIRKGKIALSPFQYEQLKRRNETIREAL